MGLSLDREGLGLGTLLTESREAARDNLTKVDFAIDRLSLRRSELGALQNRLQHEISANSEYAGSLNAGRSRMGHTDVAGISSLLAQNQIRNPSNISVMSQANSSTQMALKLIGSVQG